MRPIPALGDEYVLLQYVYLNLRLKSFPRERVPKVKARDPTESQVHSTGQVSSWFVSAVKCVSSVNWRIYHVAYLYFLAKISLGLFVHTSVLCCHHASNSLSCSRA